MCAGYFGFVLTMLLFRTTAASKLMLRPLIMYASVCYIMQFLWQFQYWQSWNEHVSPAVGIQTLVFIIM